MEEVRRGRNDKSSKSLEKILVGMTPEESCDLVMVVMGQELDTFQLIVLDREQLLYEQYQLIWFAIRERNLSGSRN